MSQQLPVTFFHEMQPMEKLSDLTNMSYYVDVPDNWYIALTDVKGSTKAINEGKYKSVNTIAAATITAMLNSIPDIEVPFLFGGDGAAIVIPPQAQKQARESLVAVQRMAKENFDLELRIGLVPVSDVLAAGFELKVAKIRISENFQQPVFMGGGLAYADTLIKQAGGAEKYGIVPTGDEEADFSGFECRWNKHPARHGEVISLMVQAVSDDSNQRNHVYEEVIDYITRIYGDADMRHPIDYDKMQVATNPNDYRQEVGVKNDQFSWRDVLRLMFWSISGYLLWRFVNGIWDDYKDTVRNATDHEKFDDMLRMTISGSEEQRTKLVEYLQYRYLEGDIVYGVHNAPHSLMTCIVFDRFGRQVHFLDADNGGYAMAAKNMKQQLQYVELRSTREVPRIVDISGQV